MSTTSIAYAGVSALDGRIDAGLVAQIYDEVYADQVRRLQRITRLSRETVEAIVQKAFYNLLARRPKRLCVTPPDVRHYTIRALQNAVLNHYRMLRRRHMTACFPDALPFVEQSFDQVDLAAAVLTSEHLYALPLAEPMSDIPADCPTSSTCLTGSAHHWRGRLRCVKHCSCPDCCHLMQEAHRHG